MKEPVNYTLLKNGDEHIITITPVNQNIPGGNMYMTGVFKLAEKEVGIGDIVFDDDMKQWEYTGMGDLKHEEAEAIANFIQTFDRQGTNNNPL